MRRIIGRRTRVLVAALGLALAGVAYSASPAQAATSWTHNNYYSYSIFKDTPSYSGGSMIAYLWNDTPVTMLCWKDTAWVYSRSYSNYNSPRWFLARKNANGQVGWVHSSYVYYQSGVPWCG